MLMALQGLLDQGRFPGIVIAVDVEMRGIGNADVGRQQPFQRRVNIGTTSVTLW